MSVHFILDYVVRSLVIIIINNQVLNKIKIAVRISSQKGHKYDENMMKI